MSLKLLGFNSLIRKEREVKNMSEIKFFGEVDVHPTKKVVMSEYPAWYMQKPMENLREEYERKERELERGVVPQDKIFSHKEDIEKLKEKYEKIVASIPKLSGEEKDKMSKARKEMSKIIQSGYYKRSDMIKGTVDAHREAERMVKPMVEVKPEYAEYLQAANVPIRDGKVTRDGLVKAWKLCGRLINIHGGDEDTNAEVLRRD
jgi:hypothetical protein